MDAFEYLRHLENEAGLENQGVGFAAARDARLNQTGVDIYGYMEDTPQARLELHQKYFSSLKAPFMEAEDLSDDLKSIMRRTAVGTLPFRSVNACILQAPNGDPVVVFDFGLMKLLSFYIEAQFACEVIRQSQGQLAYLRFQYRVYELIIKYFQTGGQISIPIYSAKMPQKFLMFANTMTYAAEMFVLGHETAHVYSGHFAHASIRKFRLAQQSGEIVDVYQLSREQEFEADRLGWEWFQSTVTSTPFFKLFGPVVMTGPFYLFQLIALVEANFPSPLVYATHPPAVDRLASLAESLTANINEVVKEGAYGGHKVARTSPQLSQLREDLLVFEEAEKLAPGSVQKYFDSLTAKINKSNT